MKSVPCNNSQSHQHVKKLKHMVQLFKASFLAQLLDLLYALDIDSREMHPSALTS